MGRGSGSGRGCRGSGSGGSREQGRDPEALNGQALVVQQVDHLPGHHWGSGDRSGHTWGSRWARGPGAAWDGGSRCGGGRWGAPSISILPKDNGSTHEVQHTVVEQRHDAVCTERGCAAGQCWEGQGCGGMQGAVGLGGCAFMAPAIVKSSYLLILTHCMLFFFLPSL